MRRGVRAVLCAAAALTTPLLVACGDGDEPAGTPTVTPTAPQAASPTSSPVTTPTVATEDEVLAAYAYYWDVYAEALFDVDPSRLSEVMTGARLQRALDEIERLKDDGQAVRIVVDNDPLVVSVGGGEAVVADVYENSSYLVDATTKEPVGDRGEPNTLRDTFTLVLEDGLWKVRDSLRQVDPQ